MNFFSQPTTIRPEAKVSEPLEISSFVLEQSSPRWIELTHGVRVKVRPLSTALYEQARKRGLHEARRLIEEQAEVRAAGGMIENLPDLADDDAIESLALLIYAQSLAISAIIEWKGVQAKDGRPVLVTSQNVNDLMMIHRMADSFLEQYDRPN